MKIVIDGRKDYCTQMPMKELWKLLPHEHFHLIKNNCIVGIVHIIKIDKGDTGFAHSKVQQYFVSFKIVFVNNPTYYGVASNILGVKFSTIQYTTSSPPAINNFAHVYSTSIIIDTLNWTRIRGSFISDSTYQYINIGNFFDDAHTDSMHVTDSGNEYYYIDDICVSTDSNTCYSSSIEGIPEISLQELIAYPNPVDESIVLEQNNNETDEGKIYNVMWQRVAEFKINRNDKIIIDCSQWSDGIYIIKTKKQFKKIIIRHNK